MRPPAGTVRTQCPLPQYLHRDLRPPAQALSQRRGTRHYSVFVILEDTPADDLSVGYWPCIGAAPRLGGAFWMLSSVFLAQGDGARMHAGGSRTVTAAHRTRAQPGRPPPLQDPASPAALARRRSGCLRRRVRFPTDKGSVLVIDSFTAHCGSGRPWKGAARDGWRVIAFISVMFGSPEYVVPDRGLAGATVQKRWPNVLFFLGISITALVSLQLKLRASKFQLHFTVSPNVTLTGVAMLDPNFM